MSSDIRKISWFAVVLVVVLRISIGWHLFYEGLWKLQTRKTANPWSAKGYLEIATGPLRTTFRNLTGDPNDLKWLDFDTMSAKWDAWRERFTNKYKLSEEQLNRLAVMLDGTANGFSVPFEEMPANFSFEDAVKSAGVAKDAIKFDENGKKLIVDGKLHLLPIERVKLVEEVKDIQKEANETDQVAFEKLIKAIENVASRASKLSYRERLAGMLKGDPDRVGIIQKSKKEGEQELVVAVGEVNFYKDLIERYEAKHAKAKTKSEWDHLDRQWSELQAKRRSLVGPVQALEKDLIDDATKLLTEQQLAMGAVPDAVTEISLINERTMWSLTIFGLLLMLGLFTRLSALGGAGLLTLFYMALPPWPGLQEPPGIEHNLIVNKVFVEIVALFAVATMPSGKWFGVDAIVSAIFRQRKNK